MQNMVTFTIHIPQMLAYIPYMDPMGIHITYRIYDMYMSHTFLLRGWAKVCNDEPCGPEIGWTLGVNQEVLSPQKLGIYLWLCHISK
jgi:hypothetical protein